MSTSTNLYNQEVNFAELAKHDEAFAKVLQSGGGRVDFHKPEAVQQLTRSLLKRNFNLSIELPDDRLCPPIPVRYHYIRWLQDLVDCTSESFNDAYKPDRKVLGLDIGTGASCIYPLLGCSTRPNWYFLGTDVDPKSLAFARRNVTLNDLDNRIRIHETTADAPLFSALAADGIQKADFTMCNPPFYTSVEDMQATYSNKLTPPSAVCTGAEVEMIYPDGGDLGFVLRMVNESRALGDQVRWFSSMLGKLASAKAVIARLKELHVTNWAICCLKAGSKTRRWAIAWSFQGFRPPNEVARREMFSMKELLPSSTEIIVPLFDKAPAFVARIVDETLSNLNLRWIWKKGKNVGVGLAKENVWSRAARRKHEREAAASQTKTKSSDDMDVDGDSEDDENDKDDVALAFKVTVTDSSVDIRWLRGENYILFESFCGMLKRTLREAKDQRK